MDLLITYGALAVFFAIVIAILQYSYVADRDFSDFTVAGRSFGGFYQAMAFLNTGLPGFIFLGSFGFVVRAGVLGIGLATLLAAIVMYLMADRVWTWGAKYDLRTQPDLMALRYDSRAVRVIAALLGIFGLMPWMNRLLEVAVLPVWHLLVAHGIAVEAHGQNMLLVHRDGWPVRLILRDFHESIEFAPDFLREPKRAPDFASLNPLYRHAEPDQYYWTDNLDSLRELVMDTLFVFNLAEISHLLDVCYGLPEFRFWQRVESLLTSYAQEQDMQHRQSLLGHDRARILTESLITRKLLALKPEYHHEVPNALAARTSERRRKP